MDYDYDWPDVDGVSVFNDHGTVYATGGERTEEFMWMDDIPEHMENHC